MVTTLDEQIIQLKQTIAEMEAQRPVLGDAAVDASLVPFYEKLAELEALAESPIEVPSEIPVRQRKLVTLLYMDVVNSTAMTQHLDPEDNLEMMEKALLRLVEPIQEHGGRVTRYTGDGFKAVFGDPIAREDDPEQAIRAGLDILDISRTVAEEIEKEWGIEEFQVRIGIDTGLAAIGGETEAEDTVKGRVVNLAVRIESAAPSGGMLISHNTYRHVRGVFNVLPHKPITAKGFTEAFPVYQVVSIKKRAFRLQTRSVEGVETRMVGRDAELLTLQNTIYNMMEEMQTQVITVVGEAGVGKSRLLYEFINWIELQPDEMQLFQGRGRRETQNLPYGLLKDIFTFHFQIQESDTAIEVRRKVEAKFGEMLGIDEEGQIRAHIIGQLLGFDFSESQHLKFVIDDPQQIHDRSLMYLAEYFHGMSKLSPVVIFLEDVHWADDSSLDMLNSLVRRIPEQRMLVLCVTRQRLYERRPHWGEGLAYHRRLELLPLTKHDSRQLVMEILQKIDKTPDLLQDLVMKSAEGNPFYIEEIIKMLIENGVILTGEEWQVESERLAVIEVPDTLTGIMQARLEGLPQEERITLQHASVVGHIFWDDTVVYINNQSTQTNMHYDLRKTEENLNSLRLRELIYHREESVFIDAAEYTFKHALLRDVTYESVLRKVRKIYHGLVAEWLIDHSSERAGEYTGLIAEHLCLAGKKGEAASYLYRAGESAANRFANDEAVEYLSRAIALTPEDDLIKHYEFLMARERVFDYQGDREAQFADLSELKGITKSLKDVGKMAQVAIREINYYLWIDEHQSVMELATKALHSAQEVGNVAYETEINLLCGMSLIKCWRLEAAIVPLEKSLSLSQTYQLNKLEADSLRMLGIVYGSLGDLENERVYYMQALKKSRQIGYVRGEALALNNLGNTYFFQCDFQYAKEFLEQALTINKETGDRYVEALTLKNLADVVRHLYDHYKAIEYLNQSLAILHEISGRLDERASHESLGWIYLDIGDYEKVISHFKQAKKISIEINNIDYENYGNLTLMLIYSRIGDYKKATSYYDQVKEVWRELESPNEKSFFSSLIAAYMYQIGNLQAGEEYARKSILILGSIEDRLLEWYRLRIMAVILEEQGRMTEASKIYKEAISLAHQANLPRHAFDTQAGLARISMARQDYEQAKIQVDEILTYMEANSPPKGSSFCLDGVYDHFRILLTCCKVLKTNNDHRAKAILEDTYKLLQTRAANIKDEHLRDCFLSNVAVNREIIEEYKKNG